MMPKNDILLQQIREGNQLEYGEVLGIQTVEKLKNSKPEEKILVVTSFNMYIFTRKTLGRGYNMSRQYRWDTLLEITSKTIYIIDFVFKDEVVTIKDQNFERILKTVVIVLTRIFCKTELPKFSFDQKLLLDANSKPLPRKKDAILDRFKFKAFSADKTLTENVYNEFRDYVMKVLSKPNVAQTLDLTRFKNYFQFTDCILDSISVCPNIKRIIIPSFPNHSYWEFMSKFVLTNPTVTTLEIYDPLIGSQFKPFVDNFTKNKLCRISRISFYDSKFDAAFVVQLAVLLESRPFTQIGLYKGITQDGFQVLVPMLGSVKGFQSIQCLSLTGSHFLNMSSIVHAMKSVRTFYFNESELDVAVVLSVFAQNPDSKCREIGLSNNICLVSIPDELNFPPNLAVIHLDSVKWSGNTMINLFKFFSRRTNVNNNVNNNNNSSKLDPNLQSQPQQLLSLDISKANMTPKQWNKFDSFLRTFDCTFLTEIYFDQNPVGSGFLSFMNRSTNIQTMSLSGCFSNGDPMIDSFADSIAENVSITKLIIRGVGVNALAESCSTVLGGICRNTKVKTLDLSNNAAGNELCSELLKILMDNYTLSQVMIDNNGITDTNGLKILLTELLRVKRCVCILPPTKDIQEMRRGKNDKTIKELMRLFSLLDQQAKSDDSESMTGEMNSMTGECNNMSGYNTLNGDSGEVDTTHPILDERVSEEYVSDLQWESMLDVVPEPNLEELAVGLLQQFTFEMLINEIRARDAA